VRRRAGDKILDYGRRDGRFLGDYTFKKSLYPKGVKRDTGGFRDGLRVERALRSCCGVIWVLCGRAGHLNYAAVVLSVTAAAGRKIRLRIGKEEARHPGLAQQAQQSRRDDPSHRIEPMDWDSSCHSAAAGISQLTRTNEVCTGSK
jgi:hypothetical protein